jgi:periplasmic divalent cation tolerance protein
MTGFVTVYVTTATAEEATEIGRGLVTARLAACANIVNSLTSIYMWNNNLEESGEAALLLKTRDSLVPQVTAWIRGIHSYNCPCIVAWPIVDGNPEYLTWIAQETCNPGDPV